jgi:hypothetical protein
MSAEVADAFEDCPDLMDIKPKLSGAENLRRS